MLPMITWSPCNPVNAKKHEPYTLSEILNVALKYSIICIKVKKNAKNNVFTKPSLAPIESPLIKQKCVHVIDTPDTNNIVVLNNGTDHAFNITIFIGGHIIPKIMAGDKLEWKNAQKNPAKNIISEPENKIKPIFNPFWTIIVWLPW